jgi:hypothetical protein
MLGSRDILVSAEAERELLRLHEVGVTERHAYLRSQAVST